ncbi:ricin-type beta-trefoil lectin domain protein [Paractinoplanes globisporus]|uniref:Ricin-type beta-trefoil lectin domain protein n=1 Tax=Paractinoplanes globisporus TaxID=113565 RepID=A0ABW6W806_9ACTN|nr:ricin-type beta-trefoil lectin domain protein [Actinoplanes globisporus]
MKYTLRRDEGSLPLAMLVVTIVLGLSATMVPIVVRQIKTTAGYDRRGAALDAAQAGMDVMMARVRAASDSAQNGYLENLPPCTMTGVVGATGGGIKSTYTVSVTYRDRDGNTITGCAVNDVPTTAIVVSAGTNGTSTRTLTATYIFSTSNTNIPGGPIKIATSSVKDSTGALVDQCLDAGSSPSPAAGTAVTVQKCNGSSQQQFGYTPDLYLKLIYSESSAAPLGTCLFANSTRVSGTTPIVFQPCPTVRTTTYQWALDGSSVFHATTSASKSDGSYCMNIKTPGTSTAVVLAACGATSTKNVWYSSPGVGAGMAGDATNQLVNYKQFSRCLDVTSKQTSSTYMIAWFCKQDPGALVDFNQQWVHPVPVLPAISKSGPIIVNNSTANSNANNGAAANNYCLKSPGIATTTSWVTVVTCPTAAIQAQAALTWTVYHDTGDYGTSYRIMDYKGFCLQPTEQGTGIANNYHSDGTSKVMVAVCSTADIQKWNAPANVDQPTPLTNLTEK